MQNKIKTFESLEFSFYPHRLTFLADGPERKITGQDVVNAMNKTDGIDWDRLKNMLGKLDRAGKWREQEIAADQLKQLSEAEIAILAKAGAEVGKVVEKTHEEGKSLRKAIETQRGLKGAAQKCENARETVANLVTKIAQKEGVDPNSITEVSVKKKGKKGEMVRLERQGNDFVEVGTTGHFKIKKGDVVIIGSEIFPSNPDKRVGIETRQDKKAVEQALGEAESEKGLPIEEITLGIERGNASEIVRALNERGIRRVTENLFIGEHGALAGVLLEERQKMPQLFDKNGKITKTALDQIADVVVAAAGKVKTKNQKDLESEILRDSARFGAEFVALVVIPSVLASLATAAACPARTARAARGRRRAHRSGDPGTCTGCRR